MSLDGDIRIALDVSGPVSVFEISGDHLELVAEVRTATLRNFSSMLMIDAAMSPETYALDVAGRLAGSEFEGDVDFETTDAFEGEGDDPPASGVLVVTGAENATQTLTALDSGNVRIDVDVDGDGISDGEPLFTTWAVLLGDEV